MTILAIIYFFSIVETKLKKLHLSSNVSNTVIPVTKTINWTLGISKNFEFGFYDVESDTKPDRKATESLFDDDVGVDLEEIVII